MVIKNVWYLFLLHVFIINSMELDLENKQLALPGNTYDTFTPRDSGLADLSSVASLHNVPQSVDLSLDLNDGPQEEITDLDDDEVNFLVKACQFTKKLKDVSKKRAKAVVREQVGHPKIQKIISTMRQQKANPNEVNVDHDKEEVRSAGIEVGVDARDIYKVYHDLSGLMWKEDRTCCGRTISKETGQKIISYGLTGFTVASLFACNTFLIVYFGHSETVNNFYNCTYP